MISLAEQQSINMDVSQYCASFYVVIYAARLRSCGKYPAYDRPLSKLHPWLPGVLSSQAREACTSLGAERAHGGKPCHQGSHEKLYFGDLCSVALLNSDKYRSVSCRDVATHDAVAINLMSDAVRGDESLFEIDCFTLRIDRLRCLWRLTPFWL